MGTIQVFYKQFFLVVYELINWILPTKWEIWNNCLSKTQKTANRFKTDINTPDDHKKAESKVVVTTQRTVVVGQLPEERVIEEGGKDNDPTKATDDLHLTKFKKQFQRK